MCNAASGSQRISKPLRVSLSLDKRLQAAQASQKFPTFVSSLTWGSQPLHTSLSEFKPLRGSQRFPGPLIGSKAFSTLLQTYQRFSESLHAFQSFSKPPKVPPFLPGLPRTSLSSSKPPQSVQGPSTFLQLS